MKSIPFQYYGYYYSDKNGAIQVLTYTGQNLFDEYKEPITLEEFWKIAEPKSDECDAAEYLDNWDKYSLNPLTGKIMPKPSYTAKDIEEYHDNLLFSTVSEFS